MGKGRIMVDVYGWKRLAFVFEWMGKHALGLFVVVTSNIDVVAIQGFYWKAPENNIAPQNSPLERQDLNESTWDMSLGLKAYDGENDSDLKQDQNKDGQIERLNSSSIGT